MIQQFIPGLLSLLLLPCQAMEKDETTPSSSTSPSTATSQVHSFIRPVLRGETTTFEDQEGGELLHNLHLRIEPVASQALFKMQVYQDRLDLLADKVNSLEEKCHSKASELFPDWSQDDIINFLYWFNAFQTWEKEKFDLYCKRLPSDIKTRVLETLAKPKEREAIKEYLELYGSLEHFRQKHSSLTMKHTDTKKAFETCNQLPHLIDKLLGLCNEDPYSLPLNIPGKDFENFSINFYGTNFAAPEMVLFRNTAETLVEFCNRYDIPHSYSSFRKDSKFFDFLSEYSQAISTVPNCKEVLIALDNSYQAQVMQSIGVKNAYNNLPKKYREELRRAVIDALSAFQAERQHHGQAFPPQSS